MDIVQWVALNSLDSCFGEKIPARIAASVFFPHMPPHSKRDES